ncbi:hypothetical protein LTR37_014615 [Vermiconidia calcicola]|uniref:Uncharacterized protein n=1 Tax=Vermiconidia calcicola TaxID=1690605 RepID=A0ACC3MSY8_9PEZI|nr:hypothetical protein LTR37_014615 [Vermiconidia calcicola]
MTSGSYATTCFRAFRHDLPKCTNLKRIEIQFLNVHSQSPTGGIYEIDDIPVLRELFNVRTVSSGTVEWRTNLNRDGRRGVFKFSRYAFLNWANLTNAVGPYRVPYTKDKYHRGSEQLHRYAWHE